MEYKVNNALVYASSGGMTHKSGQKTLLFVHGAGMDHTVWVLFNRYFARNGFNTLAVDLPGHGQSQGSCLSSIEDMAAWLSEFIERAKLDEIILIGHSMGSLVCIETAGNKLSQCVQLVLLGAACPMPVGEALLSAARENKHSAVDMIMLFGHAYSSQLGGNPVAGVNIVNSNKRLLERALNDTLYTDLNACNEYANGLNAAAQINIPCNLILGEEDKMTPWHASQALAESLQDVIVETIPGCGHMMMAEDPESVHRALVSKLTR